VIRTVSPGCQVTGSVVQCALGTLDSGSNTPVTLAGIIGITGDRLRSPPRRTWRGLLLIPCQGTTFATVTTTVLAVPSLVVNSAADPGDGVCDQTECTLREALATANAAPGPHVILFNIPGAGRHTIQPTLPLPMVVNPVTLDGYTQSGAGPNTSVHGDDAVLLIELDGTRAGASVDGLTIRAGQSTVRGLVINRFTGNGLVLQVNGGNVITGNFIGSNTTGTSGLGNTGAGVFVSDSPGNVLGGTTPAERNLTSESAGRDQALWQRDDRHTDAGQLYWHAGRWNKSPGNNGGGVILDHTASHNTIGGTSQNAGNVIVYKPGQRRDGHVRHRQCHPEEMPSLRTPPWVLILAADGVTPNDPGDGDGGANLLQNFPDLTWQLLVAALSP